MRCIAWVRPLECPRKEDRRLISLRSSVANSIVAGTRSYGTVNCRRQVRGQIAETGGLPAVDLPFPGQTPLDSAPRTPSVGARFGVHRAYHRQASPNFVCQRKAIGQKAGVHARHNETSACNFILILSNSHAGWRAKCGPGAKNICLMESTIPLHCFGLTSVLFPAVLLG